MKKMQNPENPENKSQSEYPEMNESSELVSQQPMPPSTDGLSGIRFDPNEQNLPSMDPYDEALAHGDLLKEDIVVEKNDEPDEKKKVKVRRKTKYDRGSGVRSMSAVVVYIIVILTLSVILAAVIISAGNDAFAFDKEDVPHEITISDTDMPVSDVAKMLEDEGIIKHAWVFKLYVKFKNDNVLKLQKGTYTISSAANYDKIIATLNPKKPRNTVTVTIPEGFTTDQIIDLLVSKGIGTREGFVEAIQYADYDYWFVDELKPNKERTYRLDGYLFPDTYYFFTDSDEETVVKRLLSNFNKKIKKSYRERCEELGMTLDEVVILASLVEAEAKYLRDFTYISSVFHHRLENTKNFPHLESDATLEYYFFITEGERHEKIYDVDKKIESPYNTYYQYGLMPGAICNPSLNAIKAALYPEDPPVADADPDDENPQTRVCYYFVYYRNGVTLYAQTLKEHEANIAKIAREQAADQ